MSRAFQFFRDVRSELTKVVWPTRQETIRYTITVIIFSIVIAAILGAADYGLLKGFEAIINK
jgi:preprotein translocase subunit SecE